MNIDAQERLLLSRLTRRERSAEIDEDTISDLVAREGQAVVSYEWDSQIPGGCGASWLTHWRGRYFVVSSDYPGEGPFDAVASAFGSEAFAALSGA